MNTSEHFKYEKMKKWTETPRTPNWEAQFSLLYQSIRLVLLHKIFASYMLKVLSYLNK